MFKLSSSEIDNIVPGTSGHPSVKGKDRNVLRLKRAIRVQFHLPTGLKRAGPSFKFHFLFFSLSHFKVRKSEQSDNHLLSICKFSDFFHHPLRFSARLCPLSYFLRCLFEQ